MTTPAFPDLSPEEITKALDIARKLIKAGVPVFAASPCPPGCAVAGHGGGGIGKYHLPRQWEKTIPSEVWLDPKTPAGWRPGWALAAVGGHVVDFLDGDPRNGGEQSLQRLHDEGLFPLTFGRQKTPSGGDHWLTAPTGLRKATGEIGGFLPGLDLQAGDSSGQGRGFVWIAPTVRVSKATGELTAYRWEVEPDLGLLAEQIEDARDSVEGITALIERNRADRLARPREREPRESAPGAVYSGAADLFMTPSQVGAGLFGNDRSFTLAEAQDFVRPCLLDLQRAQVGTIEETANIAAATLSHFVPNVWTADQAFALLEHSLALTAYDPNGPSDWTADKFRPVLDGRRPPLDPWTATLRPEPPTAPAVVVESQPGQEGLSTVEKLRARMVTAKELAARPSPSPLIAGLLNLNTEAWLIGAPGSLKSFVALDIAGCVGRGAPWQGRRTEKRDVLYIAAEGEGGMVLRTRAYIAAHDGMDGVTFLPYPVQVKSSDGQWDALVQIAAEDQPGLIVIDTQHRVSVGLEENSATDMGILIAAIGRLKRATRACILVIHHTGRNGGDARGSSALDGAQDTELKVIRDEPRDALMCHIVMDKQKDMAELNGRNGIPIGMKIIDLGQDEHGHPLSSLVVDPDADAVHAAMTAREGFTAQDAEEWKGQNPQEWTAAVCVAAGLPRQSTIKRRILQVLADHAYDRGLTQAEAKRIVTARWYPDGKTPSDSWGDGWSFVVSLPIVVGISGEKYAIDQAELSALKAKT